jgi:hypothetical protein
MVRIADGEVARHLRDASYVNQDSRQDPVHVQLATDHC